MILWACIFGSMNVCMYVCMYVGMHVCMHCENGLENLGLKHDTRNIGPKEFGPCVALGEWICVFKRHDLKVVPVVDVALECHNWLVGVEGDPHKWPRTSFAVRIHIEWSSIPNGGFFQEGVLVRSAARGAICQENGFLLAHFVIVSFGGDDVKLADSTTSLKPHQYI